MYGGGRLNGLYLLCVVYVSNVSITDSEKKKNAT
jgi:hypothetical protein